MDEIESRPHVKAFRDAYAREIAKDMTRHPEQWAIPVGAEIPAEAHKRATKMIDAMCRGIAVCSSVCMRRAAKRIGLLNGSQPMIIAYLKGEVA